MENKIVNNTINANNFTDTVNNLISALQTFDNTKAEKGAMAEKLRAQQEGIFASIQQIISFSIRVNNDTNLVSLVKLFNTFGYARTILNTFKYAVKRNNKTGVLKRSDYAKRAPESAADSVLKESNPYAVEVIEARKEAKKQEKANAPRSTRLEQAEKGVNSLKKKLNSLGLLDYVKQLEAMCSTIQADKDNAQQEEAQEIQNMPSLAVQEVKAA
ncbi:hypothetical protein ABX026_01520 [Snodgrassella alvi]|uniref:hypothetical protein n=1 Tax=Snodgrassella alvi TaxID=1196083 RepID=UPI003460451F